MTAGPGEAAKRADHGDNGDAAGRGLTAKDAGGQCPERAHEAEKADGGEGKGEQTDDERVGEGGPGEANGADEHAGDHVKAALAKAVAGPADDDGDNGGGEVGQGGEADDERVAGAVGKLLCSSRGGVNDGVEDQWHPEVDGVEADLIEQEDAGEDPDHGQLEGVGEPVFVVGATLLAVALELGVEKVFFVVGEPGRVVGVVAHEEEDGDAAEDGGDALGR